MKQDSSLEKLLEEVRACRICENHLPLGPRPVLRIHREAKILISGQAPGTKVHATGIPWNDLSGKKLREWLGVGSEIFYDETQFAVLPKGFCYPGKGLRGDLPPREECAQLYFEKLLSHMPNLQLILPIGIHSQAYFLKGKKKSTLAETVSNYKNYLPTYLPLPHPSPRNIMWFRKNAWFENEVVPALQQNIKRILQL
ncbi:MAG: uracil-DNA glycosylase family protein [Sphingobacteriales bacterium]|nr:MAG: uracil-DNA glycosylase family protein [Sphingobacteriales bacterium]